MTLHIRWPKYWSFSINPSIVYSGLISFRIDWFDLAVQGTSLAPQFESINSSVFSLPCGPTLTYVYDYWKNHSFDNTDLCQQSDVSFFLHHHRKDIMKNIQILKGPGENSNCEKQRLTHFAGTPLVSLWLRLHTANTGSSSVCKTQALDHFPGSSAGKESACNAGDPGSIPGSGRFPGEGIGTHSSILGLPLRLGW